MGASDSDTRSVRQPGVEAMALGEAPLTVADVVEVARERRRVRLLPEVREQMRGSAEWVERATESFGSAEMPTPVYGVNTGFGSLADRAAFTSEKAAELSRRLVMSNTAGVGRYLDEEVVRAATLIPTSLAQGYSGAGVGIVETLLEMLNKDVYAAIPEYGSLGASGDLIPLAHLALVATRPIDDDPETDSGEAFVDEEIASGKAAMERAGISRVALGSKEGLAFLDGTSFCTGVLVLALADAERTVETSEVAMAMTTEALLGFRNAFLDDLHQARGHRGQIEGAAHIRGLLEGSRLIDVSREQDPERQPPLDAYSLRCTPQVLDPVRDTLNRELPDMLIAAEEVRIDCEYMLPQYLAAGLVSDCKTLVHPDSADSIPTCANQEDHVSMGMNAARHARQVVINAETVVAIEVLMATQAPRPAGTGGREESGRSRTSIQSRARPDP